MNATETATIEAFIAGRRRPTRYQMRAVVRLLGQVIGRPVTVSDLLAVDAEQRLEAYMRNKLYQRSTVRGYVTALRQLRRAAENSPSPR